MTILGFSAQVSWNVVLQRAFLATLATEAVILGFDLFVNNHLFPAGKEPFEDSLAELWQRTDGLEPVSGDNRGSLLNVTLAQETIPLDGAREEAAAEEFKPLAPRQINPNVEKIIKDDPLRAAEIIRKMGLE